MLRLNDRHSLRWADKTLSMLKAKELEACEKDLAGLPGITLFDPECSDLDAEALFDSSWYAREPHQPALHTIDGLQALVLEHFPAELALLSREEYDLIVRLVLTQGKLRLWNWSDVIPARSLVRRLWCRVEGKGENMTLILPQQLCLTAMLLMTGDAHQAVRKIVDAAIDKTDDTLYLIGSVLLSTPLNDLCQELRETFVGNQPRLVTRLLLASHTSVTGPDGQRLLIHPGLAEPETLTLNAIQRAGLYGMDVTDLSHALDSLDTIEDPLYSHLEALLTGSLRPDLTPEDAAEDLILLAKQNVPLADLEDVLGSMLMTVPTPPMLQVLKEISEQVPRWIFLSSSVVQ